MMHKMLSDHYRFEDFNYSPTEGVIVKDNQRTILKGRENELLHLLVKAHPYVVTRETIQETLWSNSYTTDATINQAVKTLRDDLYDNDRTLIRTIPKTGYILGASPFFVSYESRQVRRNKRRLFIYLPTLVCWAIVSLVAFGLGYYFSTPKLSVPQFIEGNNNYLFHPSITEKARFSVRKSDDTKMYIERMPQGYRYCEYQQKIMQCKNIF